MVIFFGPGIARRFCTKVNSSYAEWSSPDLSDCVSNWINDFSYQVSLSLKRWKYSHSLILSLIFFYLTRYNFCLYCLSIHYSLIVSQLRRKERNSSYLMKALNKEYKKQIDVVGGDIKNVVTMMADIVDMMLSSKANDKELKDTAEVFNSFFLLRTIWVNISCFYRFWSEWLPLILSLSYFWDKN